MEIHKNFNITETLNKSYVINNKSDASEEVLSLLWNLNKVNLFLISLNRV